MLCCLSSPWLQPADQMIWCYTEIENWRKWFSRAPHRVLSVCCWLTARIPKIPLRMCYCSGSGTCNRSEVCFSFFHFSLTLHYLSVSSCNSSVCSELLTTVHSLPRPRLQLLIVRQQQRRYFSFCRDRWTKSKPHWLYQIWQQIMDCHMLATKIRGRKTPWLWVIFTHVQNCHTLLLNLSGLNVGFPWIRRWGSRTLQPSRTNLMKVSFILVCTDGPACVSQPTLSS